MSRFLLARCLAAALLLAAGPAQAQRTIPDVPQNVQVTEGDASLTLTWQAPASWGSFPATSYQIDWRIGTSGDWIPLRLRGSSDNFDLAATTTSYTFTGSYHSPVRSYHTVTNGTTYQLRIRAVSVNPSDQDDTLPSRWVMVSGTPTAQQTTPTGVTLTASDLTPTEGETVTLTATLDAAAPTGGVTLTLKVLDKVSETIYTSATATADYTLSPSTISIAGGSRSGTATLSIVDDSAVEDNWYSIAGETVVLSAVSTTPALTSKPLVVTIIDNDGLFAGHRPGQPTLEAITSGTNAPTATTLSFNVGCVRGGGSPITDYILWAENVDDPLDYSYQTFTAPDPSLAETCNTIMRTMDELPSRSSATTYRVRASARSLTGFHSPWSPWVEVATPASQNQVIGNCDTCGTEGEEGTIPAPAEQPPPEPEEEDVCDTCSTEGEEVVILAPAEESPPEPEEEPEPTQEPTQEPAQEPEPTQEPTQEEEEPTQESESEVETSDIVSQYDANGDGVIDQSEFESAIADYEAGLLTNEEIYTLHQAYRGAGKRVATAFALVDNHPNPFNPTTTIRYSLPQAVEVELTVYNIAGQPVQTLVAEHQRAGWYAVEWDASGLAAGLYFYRLQAGAFGQVKKMMLLK